MKKFTKGFTLIELIIVMAIMTILMAALMQMMKPIRSTYVDSTLYESQRTVGNGVAQYITESVRYATDIGFYSTEDASVGNVSDAENLFLKAYKTSHPGETNAYYDAVRNRIQVITIDCRGTFGSEDNRGRLIRKKVADNTGATVQAISSDDEDSSSDVARLALGEAYYGQMDYKFNINPVYTVSAGKKVPTGDLEVTISSWMDSAVKKSSKVETQATIVLQNVNLSGGVLDISNYPNAETKTNEKTYIVFLNPKD